MPARPMRRKYRPEGMFPLAESIAWNSERLLANEWMVRAEEITLGRCSISNGNTGLTAVDSGNHADGDGPTEHQRVGRCCVPCHRVASNILEDIEAMPLNNILQAHLQQGNTKADSEIDHDGTSLLSFADCDCLDRSDDVQSPIDAERRSRDSDRQANHEAGS